MSAVIGGVRIWICATHHSAFRRGGWASVRVSQGQVSGAAGGERNTTARRMALAGLTAGLSDLAAGVEPIRIHTTSPELASLAAVLANLGAPADDAGPDEHLDLWGRIIIASKGRRLELVRMALDPDTPTAFVAAWADLARGKAKASGPFIAPIPKPNLAKVAGL